MKRYLHFQSLSAAAVKSEPSVLLAIIIVGSLSAAPIIHAKDTQLFFLFLLLLSVFVLTAEEIGLFLLALISFYFLYIRYLFSWPSLFINLCYALLFLF